MRVRVSWPNGKEREVELHTQRELDRFVGWHRMEAPIVDVKLDDDGGVSLIVRAA